MASSRARWTTLVVAGFLLLLGCKEPTYATMGEACKVEEDCASGLLCVQELGAAPRCMQACGEKGYGGCPDGWTCVGKARMVVPASALAGRAVEERLVCVEGEDLPPHPEGWWAVTAVEPAARREGDIGPGTAFQFRKRGYDLVLPNGVYDRRFVAWTRGPGEWIGKGRYEETVIKHGDDRLEIVHPYGSIELVRLGDERAREMAAVLAAAPDTEQTCARALRCCEEATAALDQRCSREHELGDGRWLRQCLNTIDGFREILTAAGVDVPESCAPLPSAETAVDGGGE